MANCAIVGINWGDEGKGRMVDLLTENYDIGVRYQGGGNAGHNGLKDITAKLSTPDFWRLRIGIGHPRVYCPQQEVYDWVLGVPEPEHREAMQKCISAALKTLENLAKGNLEGVKRTVRKYESLPKPKQAPEAQAAAAAPASDQE